MKKIFTFLCMALICSGALASGHIVTVTVNNNAGCSGACNGSATASVTGGVGPFAYVWNDPAGQITTTATGLCAGTYTITVTDQNDMSTSSASVTITQYAPVTIALPPSYYICSGDAVTLTASGALTYSWSPAAGISTTSGGTVVAAPVVTTTYTVTGTNGSGCSGFASTTVIVLPAVTATVTSVNTSGCGMCDGTASVMPAGGTAPYSYAWPSGPSGGPASGLCAGTYTVVTTESNGCTTSNVFTISDPATIANFNIVPDSANGYSILCFNSSYTASSHWDFGDGNTSTSASPVHVYSAPGVYTVCLQATEAGGCSDTVCQSVTITGTPASCLALFNIAQDTISGAPNSYTIYNLSYGASISYAWTFGDGSTSTLAHPTHVYSTSTGPYQICLTVDNGSGCVQTYCDSIFSVDSLGRTSNPISFTVVDGTPTSVTTGIAEQSALTSVSVSPNPFNDNATFVISDPANGIYTFEMTDVLGKTVRSVSNITDKQFSISRSGLESGMYFYKIYTTGNLIGAGKLIIK